jgi:hypothetical protein
MEQKEEAKQKNPKSGTERVQSYTQERKNNNTKS